MQSISCNEFHNEIISGTFKLITTPSLDGEEDVRIHQEINVALIFIKENSILMLPRTSTNKSVRKRKKMFAIHLLIMYFIWFPFITKFYIAIQ